MPNYRYVCPNKHVLEDRRAIEGRDNPTPCPECGEPMTRPFVAPATVVPKHMKAV